MPHAAFVLVGPVKRHLVDIHELEDLPNVYLLPPCAYAEVPAILATFDVCLIPYRVNAYTEGLSPIKLYECLALGKPVVATDLPYLRREAGHIRIARTADQFVSEIQQSLASPPTAEQRARWRGIATANSWERQVDQIERYLTATLERKQ
jgi:glycosyltransferase involved in cell wall biosynthesis